MMAIRLRLDGDFSAVSGDLESSEDEVRLQLAAIMNVDKSRIADLTLSPGNCCGFHLGDNRFL